MELNDNNILVCECGHITEDHPYEKGCTECDCEFFSLVWDNNELVQA